MLSPVPPLSVFTLAPSILIVPWLSPAPTHQELPPHLSGSSLKTSPSLKEQLFTGTSAWLACHCKKASAHSLFLWVSQVTASGTPLTPRSPLYPAFSWQPNLDDSTPQTDFRSSFHSHLRTSKTSLPLTWAFWLVSSPHYLFFTIISNSIRIIFMKATQSF